MAQLTIEISISDTVYYDLRTTGVAKMECTLDPSAMSVIGGDGGLYLGNLIEMLLRTAYADYQSKNPTEVKDENK